MLVLSRKVGQELVIGDNIRITVNRVGGSRVTLGIEAPSEVRIVRAELEPIVRSFEDEEESSPSRDPKDEPRRGDSGKRSPSPTAWVVDTPEGLPEVTRQLQ